MSSTLILKKAYLKKWTKVGIYELTKIQIPMVTELMVHVGFAVTGDGRLGFAD